MAKKTITFERLKEAPKKKAAPKKKSNKKVPPKPEFITVNPIQYGYNALVNNALRATTMYGQPEPDDLEERAKFYKEKYEYSERTNRSLKEQVELLKSIINSALTRSCSGSCE
jgi:hypothetical protein